MFVCLGHWLAKLNFMSRRAKLEEKRKKEEEKRLREEEKVGILPRISMFYSV